MAVLSWNIRSDDAEMLSNILCHVRDGEGALSAGAEPLDLNEMIEDLNRLVGAGNAQPTLEQSLQQPLVAHPEAFCAACNAEMSVSRLKIPG